MCPMLLVRDLTNMNETELCLQTSQVEKAKKKKQMSVSQLVG